MHGNFVENFMKVLYNILIKKTGADYKNYGHISQKIREAALVSFIWRWVKVLASTIKGV